MRAATLFGWRRARSWKAFSNIGEPLPSRTTCRLAASISSDLGKTRANGHQATVHANARLRVNGDDYLLRARIEAKLGNANEAKASATDALRHYRIDNDQAGLRELVRVLDKMPKADETVRLAAAHRLVEAPHCSRQRRARDTEA